MSMELRYLKEFYSLLTKRISINPYRYKIFLVHGWSIVVLLSFFLYGIYVPRMYQELLTPLLVMFASFSYVLWFKKIVIQYN